MRDRCLQEAKRSLPPRGRRRRPTGFLARCNLPPFDSLVSTLAPQARPTLHAFSAADARPAAAAAGSRAHTMMVLEPPAAAASMLPHPHSPPLLAPALQCPALPTHPASRLLRLQSKVCTRWGGPPVLHKRMNLHRVQKGTAWRGKLSTCCTIRAAVANNGVFVDDSCCEGGAGGQHAALHHLQQR